MSATSTHVPRSNRRWRRLALGGLVAVLVLGGLLGWYVRRGAVPGPPDVPLDKVDPEVAAAVALARQKVQQSPRSADAWGFLGKVLFAHEFANQAEICFRQAEKLDDRNPRWPYYRGLVNVYVDADEAIACFRRAVERCDESEPQTTSPRWQLASVLLAEGRDVEAEELLQTVLARNPDSAPALYLSGLLLAKRNDLEGSAAYLRRLTENPSGRRKACEKLAYVCRRLGDAKAAEKYDGLARSLPEDARWPDPLYLEIRELSVSREHRFAQATRLQEERRYSEAVELLQQMIAGNESALGLAYQLLGNNLVHLGRFAEAEQAFRNALKQTPEDAETHNRLALVLLFRGEELEQQAGGRDGAKVLYRQAVTTARDALRVNPDLVEVHLTLGQVLLRLGERQEGLAELRLCVRSRPEMANAHLILGTALAEDGQLAEAQRHLETAVRFADKNDPRPRQALERLQKQRGNSFAPGTARKSSR